MVKQVIDISVIDETIIDMYKKGYSIDYITKRYHKYKNKNKKPVTIDGITLYPANIYTKNDCRLYVSKVIYDYQIATYMSHIPN